MKLPVKVIVSPSLIFDELTAIPPISGVTGSTNSSPVNNIEAPPNVSVPRDGSLKPSGVYVTAVGEAVVKTSESTPPVPPLNVNAPPATGSETSLVLMSRRSASAPLPVLMIKFCRPAAVMASFKSTMSLPLAPSLVAASRIIVVTSENSIGTNVVEPDVPSTRLRCAPVTPASTLMTSELLGVRTVNVAAFCTKTELVTSNSEKVMVVEP